MVHYNNNNNNNNNNNEKIIMLKILGFETNCLYYDSSLDIQYVNCQSVILNLTNQIT